MSDAPNAAPAALTWLFYNPDSGWELSANHPVKSGECEDALSVERVSKVVADCLRDAWDEVANTRAALTPPAPPTSAALDVLAERARQISAEGWVPEHDDEHSGGQLALAAACYASPVRIFIADERVGRAYEKFTTYRDAWPWTDEWWKPKDRRRDLVRAAALILAEIERLDREETT
jgi:hypothetical protein